MRGAGASEKKGGLLLGLESKDNDWGLRSIMDTKRGQYGGDPRVAMLSG